jgi:hypothetical protein
MSGLQMKIMGEPQGYDRKQFIYRVGNFFLLVGTGLFILFLFSEAENNPALGYFCWSMILVILGFTFRAQWKRPVPPSGRFSILKRLLKGKKE